LRGRRLFSILQTEDDGNRYFERAEAEEKEGKIERTRHWARAIEAALLSFWGAESRSSKRKEGMLRRRRNVKYL